MKNSVFAQKTDYRSYYMAKQKGQMNFICIALQIVPLGVFIGHFFDPGTTTSFGRLAITYSVLFFTGLIGMINLRVLSIEADIGKKDTLWFDKAYETLLYFLTTAMWLWADYIITYRVKIGGAPDYIIWIMMTILPACFFYLDPRFFCGSIIVNFAVLGIGLRVLSNYKMSVEEIVNLSLLSFLIGFWMWKKYVTGWRGYLAQMSAIQGQKDRVKFLISVTHEMRSPLNAVLGKNEMIYRTADSEKIKKLAGDIRNQGKIVTSLINDILDISKIQAGSMNIVPADYKTDDMLYEVAEMIRTAAEEKHLDYILEFDSKIPSILRGDDVRIKQIILNLLTNAVKYTRTGSIRLKAEFERTKPDKGLLKVAVIDTGIGIKEENLPILSEMFVRMDEKMNHAIEGTGLGLSITKELLRLMGSVLKVESVYGEGSTFSFEIEQEIMDELPFELRNEQGTLRETMAPILSTKGVKALVVDDTDIDRSVCVNILSFYQIQAEEAYSGAMAIKKLRETKYDIVFTDHHMKEMDGDELVAKIMNEYPTIYKETAFIALTGEAYTGVEKEYIAKGFADYLAKPLEPEMMEKVLLSHIPGKCVLKR